MTEHVLEHRLIVQTEDPSLLIDIFGEELPTAGVVRSLAPGIDIRADNVEVQHGLLETAIIVHFVLQVAGGVATKVITDLLLDHFRNRHAKLTVNGKPISEVTKSTLETAMEGGKNAAE